MSDGNSRGGLESESECDSEDEDSETGSDQSGYSTASGSSGGSTRVDPDIEEQVAAEQDALNIRHEPVPVPKHNNPFQDEEEIRTFEGGLAVSMEDDTVPSGYGLHTEEWDEGGYPSVEIIRSGRRAQKEMRIALPHSIWLPRAEQWGRALYIMNAIMYSRK